MKKLALLLALCLFASAAFALEQFPTEQQAHMHCPKDVLVTGSEEPCEVRWQAAPAVARSRTNNLMNQ